LGRSRDPGPAAAERLAGSIAAGWEAARKGAFGAMEARSRERMRNLEESLRRRKRREIEDVGKILEELERAIEEELRKASEDYQPSLWPELERRQFESDLVAMRRRLERIPMEVELERSAIEARYSNVAFHAFPVSVGFVFPPNWEGSR